MAPDALIPRPDTLQVGWGWFQILLTVTFVLHILFMNALFGGAVVSFIGGLKGRGGGGMAAGDTARRVPTLVALTVNAGVAPLLFVQVLFGHLFYSSSIVMAGWWFAIIPLLIIAYYAAYGVALKYDSGLRPMWSLLVVLILAFIGLMFVNNNTMALVPGAWTRWFGTSDGSLLNLGEPTIWPRWLHMMTGAMAVGGLFVALVHQRKLDAGDSAAAEARNFGLMFFTHGTIIQMVFGIWWIIALPTELMKQFMGGSIFASILLPVGVLLGVYALVMGFQKKVKPAAVLTVATVLVMALMREVVRFGYLDGVFHPRELAVEPQISPLILFLLVFLVGIVCVVYMLKLAARAGKEA